MAAVSAEGASGTHEEDQAPPPESPAAEPHVRIIALLITLTGLAWALDVPRTVGLILFVQQFLAVVLGLGIALVFLTMSFDRKPQTRPVPRADIVAALVAFVAGCVLAVRFPVLSEHVYYHPVEAAILSIVFLVLVVEGLRRIIGWPLVIVVLVFVLYGFSGHLAPWPFTARYVMPVDLVAYLALDANAMVGVPLIVGSTIIIPFVFFGQLLRYSGGTDFFTDLSVALMGGFRGGAAKISIIASSLFGSISGSAVSNVVSTGVVTIPLMRQAGYSSRQAGAIEAVASTGGQLMPPIMGAAAFLLAEISQTPYSRVVVAAIVPALLYYLTLFLQVDFDAAKADIKPIDRSEQPTAWETLKAGWHYPLPFIVLIVALFHFNLSPERSVLYSSAVVVIGGLLFGYKGKRLHPGDLIKALVGTGFAMREILMIVAAAGIVIGVLNVTGLVFTLTNLLIGVGGNNLFLLLVMAAVISIILGMGMPTVGVYVLLATLVAPALTQSGVPKIAAHMFVLYFGMLSMITPPIAIAAFTAASLARADPVGTALTAVRYGWSAYVVPFVFVLQPEILFIGDLPAIMLAVGTTIVGIWLIAAGANGYFGGETGPALRALLLIAGVTLIMPAGAAGEWTTELHIVGIGLAIAVSAWRLVSRRNARAR